MHYLTPSDDPWMPAHISDTIEEIQRWLGDHDINLMECIDQYQICNPNRDEESGCTILGGSLSAVHDLSRRSTELAMNEQQVWTAARFLITASHRTMYYNVQGRGSSALNGRCRMTLPNYSISSSPLFLSLLRLAFVITNLSSFQQRLKQLTTMSNTASLQTSGKSRFQPGSELHSPRNKPGLSSGLPSPKTSLLTLLAKIQGGHTGRLTAPLPSHNAILN